MSVIINKFNSYRMKSVSGEREKSAITALNPGQRNGTRNVRRGRTGFSHSSDFDRRIHRADKSRASSPRSFVLRDGWTVADKCRPVSSRGTMGGSSAFVDGKHGETETRAARELRRSRGTLREPGGGRKKAR